MRYIRKNKPVLGDRKTVRKFLWLPVTIGLETRWLEYATMEMEYRYFHSPVLESKATVKVYWWKPERFVD